MNFFKIVLLACFLQSLPSLADDSASSNGSVVSGKIEKINAEIDKRFTKADKDKDGTLTLSEAQSGMPRVAKNFTAIDTAGAGTVNINQIKTYMAAQFEARNTSK